MFEYLSTDIFFSNYSGIDVFGFNLSATNGTMFDHFESSKISFNQNSEEFLMYALIVLASFIIGVGFYFLTQSKENKIKQKNTD